jgi:hypothetical protein
MDFNGLRETLGKKILTDQEKIILIDIGTRCQKLIQNNNNQEIDIEL